MNRLIIFILILFANYSNAGVLQDIKHPNQNKSSNMNIAEVLKVAYITKQINLTTEEAEKFWPVYNNYTGDIRRLRRDNKDKLNDFLDLEEKVLNVRKKYKESFKKILNSDDRTNKLFLAENNFSNMIRKEWENRLQQKTTKTP